MTEATAIAQESAFYSGFAGPLWHLDETYLDAIVSTYYREYFRLFLAQYGAKLERSSSGLADVIEHSAVNLSTFGTAWHYSCAGLREAVVNRVSDDNALDAAVACAIHLLSSGVAGEFRASSKRGFRAMLRSRVIAPTAKNIHVWRRGDNVGIMIDDKTIALPSGPNDRGNNHANLATIQSPNIKLTLLTPDAADHIGCPPPLQLSPEDVSLASENFLAAAHLLERHAPKFARWVGRVLTFVSPIEAPPGLMRSGSSRQWPAVAEISFRCNAVAIAEMFVHEATHNYFNILMMIDPVTDGSDRRLYYSPVRKCERPIEMILLAYHAFANVLLYYRECQRTALKDDGYCKRNEQEHLPDLKELEKALETTQSLTEAGEGVWRPLRTHFARPA
jgi:HEXXH motif-containing protein